AKEWGIAAWVGAMLRATDKVRRLQKFWDAGELANESVIDAFDDLAIYAVIARVMYEEEEENLPDLPHSPEPQEIGCQMDLSTGKHYGKCKGSCKGKDDLP
ncbi:hypothetical protein LCGC14_2474550, partial [marine sediment metagenome]